MSAGLFAAHGNHPHLVPVFFTEKSHGPLLYGFLGCHLTGRNFGIFTDMLVDLGLCDPDFLKTDGLGVADIKAQTIRRHQRTLLGYMVAQAVSQSRMKKMGRRMIGPKRSPALRVNLHLDIIAQGNLPFEYLAHMDVKGA